jgi:hypothetical protein
MPASRCTVCNKKLGLTPFICKCTKEYCSLHRAPEDHKCSYNYKQDYTDLLNKTVKSCVGDKLDHKI